MNQSGLNISNSLTILERAVANVIKAVTIEEAALASILNFENDIIQQAKDTSINLEEFVTINESVNGIIGTITKLQTMTQFNLQHIEELVQKIKNLNEDDVSEE